jgi:peptidoglycan-recognition protein LB
MVININFYFFFFAAELPPEQMLKATKDLIAYSARKGYLQPHYRILGHRQVRSTECPGQRLFDEIQTWDHFSKIPTGPDDTKIPPY